MSGYGTLTQYLPYQYCTEYCSSMLHRSIASLLRKSLLLLPRCVCGLTLGTHQLTASDSAMGFEPPWGTSPLKEKHKRKTHTPQRGPFSPFTCRCPGTFQRQPHRRSGLCIWSLHLVFAFWGMTIFHLQFRIGTVPSYTIRTECSVHVWPLQPSHRKPKDERRKRK